jgi:hypothetical protein
VLYRSSTLDQNHVPKQAKMPRMAADVTTFMDMISVHQSPLRKEQATLRKQRNLK